MNNQRTRIIFKDDRDSQVGRGCVLYAGHFRPEVIAIVYCAALEAPETKDGEIVVSEGYRDIRNSRDLHEELRAFDFSLNGVNGDHDFRAAVGVQWADRTNRRLGPGYHTAVHGIGSNLHMHIELDP